MTYADCKNLDEIYGTDERSPLHRAQRFPAEYAAEKLAYLACTTNERR